MCETLGCVRAVSFFLLTCLGSPAAVEIENASLSAGLGGESRQDSPPTCVVIQGSRAFSNPEGGPANIWANPPLLILICGVVLAAEWECINWKPQWVELVQNLHLLLVESSALPGTRVCCLFRCWKDES